MSLKVGWEWECHQKVSESRGIWLHVLPSVSQRLHCPHCLASLPTSGAGALEGLGQDSGTKNRTWDSGRTLGWGRHWVCFRGQAGFRNRACQRSRQQKSTAYAVKGQLSREEAPEHPVFRPMFSALRACLMSPGGELGRHSSC